MRDNLMEKSDKTVIIRKVAVAIITLLLIAYIVSVVLKANFTQIKTETANIMTVPDAISVSGYFIRDEHLIKNDNQGFISYELSDGDKISVNETVACVYKDESAAADKQTIDKLETQISGLQQLEKTSQTISASPDSLDKNIASLLSDINLDVDRRDFALANKNIETMLYNINERQIATGKVKSFSGTIAELQSRVSELKKNSAAITGKKVLSPATGYFASCADGYEGCINISDLKELMPGDLSDDKIKKKDIPDNVIGKTFSGVYWYVACEVSADEALKIKNAYQLGVDIPTANSSIIDVELESVNQKTQTSDAVVILKGSYVNAEMANIRKEDISIVVNTYKGIYVPKAAVHERQVTETTEDEKGNKTAETKNVKGVYVRIGNELQFKQIIVIYTGDDFVVCKNSPPREEWVTKEYGILKAYDDVVVEGANLYDGKIIS